MPKWSKRKLARELASRLKRQFEADLEQAKEELNWKNIKRGFNDQLEQFGRDVSRVPEAYQASWRDLRDKLPELRPVHAAVLVQQGFVSSVTQTVSRVTGEPEPAGPAAAAAPSPQREPGSGGQKPAASRDEADQRLAIWRPRFLLDLGHLDKLDDLAATLKRKDPRNGFTQTAHVATIAGPVAELARLLRGADQADLRQEYEELAGKLSEAAWRDLPETSPTPSTDSRRSVLMACDEFLGRVKNSEEMLTDAVQRAAARSRGRINFDVLRGFALSEPEGKRERCKEIQAYARWAAAEIAKIQVADYHTDAAAKAIAACREYLRVLTAFTDKQTVALTVADAAEKYEQSGRYNQVYQLLGDGGRPEADAGESGRKIAELLAGKIVQSVELGLAAAGPAAVSFDRALKLGEMPVVAGIWPTVSAATVAAVRDYVDERIDAAGKQLAELSAGTPGAGQPKNKEEIDASSAWPRADSVLTGQRTGISAVMTKTLTEEIDRQIKARKDDIQARLRGRSLSAESVIVILLEQVNAKLVVPLIKVIVDGLPTTPAGPVSGARAQALIASLSRNFGTKQIPIAEPGKFRPTRDNRGRPVECILRATPREYSGDFEEKHGRLCYDVRMAGQVGRGYLFLDNLEFEPVPQYLGTDYADPYADLPEKDARGRRIHEVRPDPTALALGPYGYQVRIGELWGYLDRYKVFTPRSVDEHALADWQQRLLVPGQDGQGQVKAGYRSEDGELVEGNWYRPLSKGTVYYLFMPKGEGPHEWASAGGRTGNGSQVEKVLERVTWEGIKAFRSIS